VSTPEGAGAPGTPAGPSYQPQPVGHLSVYGSPRSDSAKVIAVIALVVSVVCLIVVLLSQVLPFLMLGAFGGFGGSEDGGSFSDTAVGGFSGSAFAGSVAVAADGSVATATLATAVIAAAHGDLFGAVTCDPVPEASRDVSVLCRSGRAEGITSYAVVRFTSDTGQFQAMTFVYD
jgi:hypothetical protein